MALIYCLLKSTLNSTKEVCMPKQPKHRCLAALAIVLGLALVAGVIGPAAAQEKGKKKHHEKELAEYLFLGLRVHSNILHRTSPGKLSVGEGKP